MKQRLTEWRRRFHQFPELSFQEFETGKFVAQVLGECERIKVETGIAGTGVVGTLGDGEGPTVLLRADMDALPIQEATGAAYASVHDGVMHACGHDAHTAILLGAAHLLSDSFDGKGTVKFLFQPAEEAPDEQGVTGAPRVIEAGILDGVDAAVALHVCPWKTVGEVQMHDGLSMASVDLFRAEIIGTGGHGAYPHLGSDPISMLGPVLQAINNIVGRKLSPLESAVISVGSIHGGSAANVIPERIVLEGTMRSYDPATREMIITELERAFSIVQPLGGHYQLKITRGEPALDNDTQVNRAVGAAIREAYPDFSIDHAPFGLGGEDFAHIAKHVPGAMFFLGCALPDGNVRDLHTPVFDIDERCLPVGAKLLSETAMRFIRSFGGERSGS
ncbi:MAG TPA: M20 family metallopeptidase [Bacillales bacterium]|nr:M20 family metallopeptidase [Bacillales bacterium]